VNSLHSELKVSRIGTGIKILDEALPEGIPRNNMVMVVGEGGTGKSVFLLQLMFSRLSMGEPCIFVCFDDTPLAVEQNAIFFGWSIKEYVEKGMLKFLDCYSFRMNPDKTTIPKYVVYVENPRELYQLTQILTGIMDDMEMHGRGCVFVDSLTELISITEPAVAIETVKTWRAECAKERLVNLFATFHFGIKPYDDFEQILEYVVDGIIDLRYNPILMQQGLLVKQFRVRKMKGSPHITKWFTFHITRNGIEAAEESSH